MQNLLDLPTELIEMIIGCLVSVDDNTIPVILLSHVCSLFANSPSLKNRVISSVCLTDCANSVDVFRWALESAGASLSHKIVQNLARLGYRDVLEHVIVPNRLGNSSRLCSAAAEGGQFELLKWLHDTGCSWDSWTCSMAAQQGYLDILKWAIEKGCPCDGLTYLIAKYNHHSEIVSWLDTQGHPHPQEHWW